MIVEWCQRHQRVLQFLSNIQYSGQIDLIIILFVQITDSADQKVLIVLPNNLEDFDRICVIDHVHRKNAVKDLFEHFIAIFGYRSVDGQNQKLQ
jgi:hypothetical protein